MPFSKISPSSRSLNLLKKGLESPGKVLEFHLHQRVDTLKPNYLPSDKMQLYINIIMYLYVMYPMYKCQIINITFTL